MYKKIISMMVILCMALSFTAGTVFAIDENAEIKAAMKAIDAGKDTLQITYDMSPDAFLAAASKLLPEGSTVTLSFSKETDYRLYNATSEKDGSLFVNILFTCGVYTRHEMFDIKIPKLTGTDAELNADNEKINKDKALVSKALTQRSYTNDTTKEDILETVRAAVENGSTVEWADDYEKIDATTSTMGSIKGTLNLKLNQVRASVKVAKTIRRVTNTQPSKPEDVSGNTETKTSFSDVKADAYYAAAVAWAVEKKITAGTSDTTFSPDDTCTRAQILTFLWRAVGSPKIGAKNPFSDVSADDYYYDAAIWANQKGMVLGDKFEGNTPCTRSSTVMYLWKNAGAPNGASAVSFGDVDNSADYAKAVAWAVENKITSGTSATEFSPEMICNRGQIVTFLNRAVK